MWSLSDESLLAGLSSGDPGAQAAFVRRFQARVYGLAVTIVGSHAVAEEVAQEAFIRAWRHAAAYDARRGRVATWLLSITRNVAIDVVRVRRHRAVDPNELLGMLASREDDDAGTAFEDAERLRKALLTLPDEQRTAVVLSVFYGLTGKEIAKREDIPLGTVKTRVRAGLIKLREVLEVGDE
jgi:RNA polymerase sigma-70 factor (ECF subfamily)